MAETTRNDDTTGQWKNACEQLGRVAGLGDVAWGQQAWAAGAGIHSIYSGWGKVPLCSSKHWLNHIGTVLSGVGTMMSGNMPWTLSMCDANATEVKALGSKHHTLWASITVLPAIIWHPPCLSIQEATAPQSVTKPVWYHSVMFDNAPDTRTNSIKQNLKRFDCFECQIVETKKPQCHPEAFFTSLEWVSLWQMYLTCSQRVCSPKLFLFYFASHMRSSKWLVSLVLVTSIITRWCHWFLLMPTTSNCWMHQLY